jgi:hypothetical protein
MPEPSHDWAAPENCQGGTAVLEHRTLAPEITPELDQACDAFEARVEWMIDQGMEGEWVAMSGPEILDHGPSKTALATRYATLYQEKKLLLRRVFLTEKVCDYQLW